MTEVGVEGQTEEEGEGEEEDAGRRPAKAVGR